MRRRDFVRAVAVGSIASHGLASRLLSGELRSAALARRDARRESTWLFWDWWHVEHQDNVALCQSRAESTS